LLFMRALSRYFPEIPRRDYGVNADRYASDYTLTERTLTKNSKLRITMAKGGGFVVVLKLAH